MKKTFIIITTAVILSSFLFAGAAEAVGFDNPLEHKTFGELINAIINFIFNIVERVNYEKREKS